MLQTIKDFFKKQPAPRVCTLTDHELKDIGLHGASDWELKDMGIVRYRKPTHYYYGAM